MPSKQNKKQAFPWMIYIKLAKFHSVILLFSVIALFILFKENLLPGTNPDVVVSLNRIILFKFIPFIIFIYLIALWVVIKNDEHIGNVIGKISNLESNFTLAERLKLFYQNDEWTKIEATLEKAEEESLKQLSDLELENEKVKNILATITDGILAIDQNQKVLFTNQQLKQKNVLSYPEIKNAYQAALTESRPTRIKDIKIIASNNEPIYFDIVIAPLKDSTGKVFGALGVFHDVTENKLAEQMRVDFVANVSHEVRTPLTSIKGYSQLLKGNEKEIPQEFHEYVDKILANSDRMISLFSDLLDLSVIEAHAQIQTEKVDPKSLIEFSIENVKPTLEKKNISVKLDLVNHALFANKRLLEQVVVNLIDNALRYSPMGSTIFITTKLNERKYRFEFKDQGPGIDKIHHKRIFERFYRIETTRDQHEKGTGIGLSLVKHIIQKHQGNIWVESEVGHGANFIFEIPPLEEV